ncbi:MAG: hypothetical protein LLG37_00945 [Spirochaetia bacterium]|nr:hypothetical protein [Spirochaetia bacterium]
MEDLIRKTEAAKIFKVSLPTFNKFLKQHGEFLQEGKVDLCRLLEWMEAVSGPENSNRGK